jgi:hypothetical protein
VVLEAADPTVVVEAEEDSKVVAGAEDDFRNSEK